jgi:hypothetical protein
MTFSWYPLLATPIVCILGATTVVGLIDRDKTDRDDEAIEAVDRSRVADRIIVCVVLSMVCIVEYAV